MPQTLENVEKLLDKFMDIDVDGSGCISTDEFFRFISLEPTPFARFGNPHAPQHAEHSGLFRRKLFDIIDQNGSGEIDFNEFLVGLWNMCTFDEESLLRFAFNLIDKDSSGYVDGDEVEQCVKDVHGSRYDKKLTAHIKRVLKKYDKNKDGQYSFDEFKRCSGELPLLFMPAFSMRNVMQEEFYGGDFWKHAAKARKRDRGAQNIKEFIAFNKKCQDEQEAAQFATNRAMRRAAHPVHVARGENHIVKLKDMDAPKVAPKSKRALRRERIHADATGVKTFSLDENERFGKNEDEAPERKDRARHGVVGETW